MTQCGQDDYDTRQHKQEHQDAMGNRGKGMPFLKTLLILLFQNYLQATLSSLQEPTATVTTSGTPLVYSTGHHLAYVCHGS